MGFLKKAFEFLSRPSHSRTMGLVVMLLLVTAVFLTVYVAQQQQQLRQRAADFCSEVTNQCGSDVTLNSTCNTPTTRCRLGNIIVECK